MIVYFSASARNMDRTQKLYKDILNYIRAYGGILTNGWGQSSEGRRNTSDDEDWTTIVWEARVGIEDADVVIVEGGGASCLGVGFELANALYYKKPTLLLIRREELSNSYAWGIEDQNLVKRIYTDQSLRDDIGSFMGSPYLT